MKKKSVSMFIVFIPILCLPNKMSCSEIYGDTIVPKYKISTINERDNFYIIYASKDNNRYKILSKKSPKRISSKRHKIQSGKLYPIKVESLLLKELNGIELIPSDYRVEIDFCGEAIIFEPFSSIKDLLIAKNMDGLCLKTPPKYKIKIIEEHSQYYVVYAEKNDTLIKVLSKKITTRTNMKHKIRPQRNYPLDIQSLFPKTYNGNGCLLSIDYSSPCIEYCGDTIYVEPEKGIKDIFIARNLDGLYLEDYY